MDPHKNPPREGAGQAVMWLPLPLPRRPMRLPLAPSRPHLVLITSAMLATAPLATAGAQRSFANALTIGTVDSVYSKVIKEQRPYLVYLPPSYKDTTYTPQRYPVLYLLDGDAHFHSVTGLLQILGTGVNGTFVVPEMIVVAIPNTNRMRDLSPTQVTAGFDGKPDTTLRITGGGPNFLSFMKNELIPRIDATYRTAPYRVFVGHSLGGLMAFSALYTMPEVFNAYVAIDPSLWWDNRRLLKDGPAFFSKPTVPGRTLFVGQANTLVASDTADNPHYNSIIRMNALIEGDNKAGVRYNFRYYPNDSHGSVPLIAEYDALRFIFDGYSPDLMRALEDPSYVKAHYEKVSKIMGYPVLPPEGTVDLLAMIQMGREKAKAIEMLRLNTELYPASVRAKNALQKATAGK